HLEAAEQPAPFEIGAHDRGDARPKGLLAGERSDGDRHARGAGAGDLDRELRPGERWGEQKYDAEQSAQTRQQDLHPRDVPCKTGDYRHPSLLFVLRPEAKFQLPLEEVGLVGLGQRRGLKNGALYVIVVALVTARLAQTDADHLAGGQLGHIEDRLRIAADVVPQADVAADLRADLVDPRGERAVARRRRDRLLARRSLAPLGLAALLVDAALLLRELLVQPLLELDVLFRRGLRLAFGFRLRRLDGDVGLLHRRRFRLHLRRWRLGSLRH